METTLRALIKLEHFSSGRRIFALRNVRRVAAGMGFDTLIRHIDRAIAHDKNTYELDQRWRKRESNAPSVTVIHEIDILVDHTLSGLRRGALAQTKGARPGDAVFAQVERFVGALFPAGLFAVTSLSYEDELVAVEAIVAKLHGDLAPLVADLGLTRLAQRLAKLAVEYRTAQQANPNALDFGTVRAARNRGQDYLLEAVALILGRYYQSDAPEHIAARNALLGPILAQQEAISMYLHARRPVPDVDPEDSEPDSEPDSGTTEDTLPGPTA